VVTAAAAACNASNQEQVQRCHFTGVASLDLRMVIFVQWMKAKRFGKYVAGVQEHMIQVAKTTNTLFGTHIRGL